MGIIAARSTVWQSVQIGRESPSAPGTPVAATHQFLATYINPRPQAQVTQNRPPGAKFATTTSRGAEHTTATLEGPISYHEQEWLLRSLLTNAGGKTFKLSPFAVDPIDTLTVECGSAARCERFPYGVVSSMRWRFMPEEATHTSEMFGWRMQEGHTITGGATKIGKPVVNPKTVSVWIGDSVAGLTQVSTFQSAEVEVGNRWGPFFSFETVWPSFTKIVERAPSLTGSLVILHEAEAASYMADLRASTQKFIRIKASETISAVSYLWQLTIAADWLENDRGDQDDAYVSTWNFGGSYNEAFAGAVEIVLQN